MINKIVQVSLILALGLSFAAEPALAMGNFTPESAAVWVARANRLIEAGSGDNANNSEELIAGMKGACSGITMEVSRPNIPDWAQRGQLYFCHSLDGVSNRFLQKAACDNMKEARGAFAKANPAKDPEEVVAVAQRLHDLSDLLLEVYKAKKYCR